MKKLSIGPNRSPRANPNDLPSFLENLVSIGLPTHIALLLARAKTGISAAIYQTDFAGNITLLPSYFTRYENDILSKLINKGHFKPADSFVRMILSDPLNLDDEFIAELLENDFVFVGPSINPVALTWEPEQLRSILHIAEKSKKLSVAQQASARVLKSRPKRSKLNIRR